MTDIVFVRHCETQANAAGRYLGWSDSPFTARGHAQMRAAIQSAHKHTPAVVYASDTPRAFTLAQAIGQARDVPVVPMARLREMNFGLFEGRTYDELARDHASALTAWYNHPWTASPPEGESAHDVWQRFSSAIAAMVQHHPGERIAVVTHGGPLRMWVAQWLWADPSRHFEVSWPHGSSMRWQID